MLLWTSTLDLDWNDLPVKPVFLPFVHTLTKYLADFTEAPASLTVGQVIPAPGKGRAVAAEIISFTSVISRGDDDRLRTYALFGGDHRLALRRAADVSRQVHIKYTGRKYKRVVALLDPHYEELWLGGKASYRLGAVIEEGGELVIYAPHLYCISDTHGESIERFGGYAPLEKVKELVAASGELQANLCVAAHLAHVAYAGRTDETGDIVLRYRITLASAVDEETCRRVNLGYLDPGLFNLSDYEGDPDTLIVERAGRDLYLIEPHDD